MTDRKLRIVIFEDDPGLAGLLKQVLDHKGHEVHVFPDASACPAYRDHQTQCPKDEACADVIITDHMMPYITGTDLLLLQRMRGCKALDVNKAIITGSFMNQDLKNAVDSLGCMMFKKPFKIAEILAWVDECADRV